MNNERIRTLLKSSGIRNYELAAELNISETGFCKKLRYELPENEQQEVFHAIQAIIKRRETSVAQMLG